MKTAVALIKKHLQELLAIGKLAPKWLSNNRQKWWDLYDQCIWDVIVSNEKELIAVFDESWAHDLPTPIHALICQRLALITEDSKIKDEAISLTKNYCNPSEVKSAILGVN